MWKRAWILAAIAVTGCKQGDSKLDPVLGSRPPATGSGSAATTATSDAGPVEERLARVERRLDRVIALLEQSLPPEAPKATDVIAVPIDPIDPALGPADAKVTIVEVFEFPCAQCQTIASSLDAIRAKYPADIRVVGKYLPVRGQAGVMAGLVACAAAKQGKYEPVKAALWSALHAKAPAAGSALAIDHNTPDGLKKLAATAGADPKQIETDLVACQQWLKTSQQTLRALGVTSVPALFVNGRFLEGAVTAQQIEDTVLEARQRAADDIASGIPQAEYYQRAILEKGAKRPGSRFDD